MNALTLNRADYEHYVHLLDSVEELQRMAAVNLGIDSIHWVDDTHGMNGYIIGTGFTVLVAIIKYLH